MYVGMYIPVIGQNVVPAPPKAVPTQPEFIGPPYPPASEPEKAKDQTAFQAKQDTKQNVSTGGSPPEAETKNTPQEKIVYSTIDVIRDYDWTYSRNKISRADEIPYIEIKEFKLAGNSYITSLMTSALLFPDVAKANVEALGGDYQELSKSFFDAIANFKDNTFAKFISQNKQDIINKIANNAKDTGSKFAEQVKKIDNSAAAWNIQDLKDKYEYLYIRKPTGLTYRFPHFDNNFFNIGNSFDDTYQGETTPWQASIENLTKTVSMAANLTNFASVLEPGMYIQRPKFYNFSNSEYTTSVDFYLFNTLKPNSYLKNLQLITKLVIQNSPHRFSRILVDPPCIYELTIPGRGFYPYAHISALQVQHEGTKRILTNSEGKQAIIPDAFKVHIEFKSLTTEVNNFFIPQTGTTGIDVSKRYGVASILKPVIKDIIGIAKEAVNFNKTEEDQAAEKQRKEAEEKQKKEAEAEEEKKRNAKPATVQKYIPRHVPIMPY